MSIEMGGGDERQQLSYRGWVLVDRAPAAWYLGSPGKVWRGLGRLVQSRCPSGFDVMAPPLCGVQGRLRGPVSLFTPINHYVWHQEGAGAGGSQPPLRPILSFPV